MGHMLIIENAKVCHNSNEPLTLVGDDEMRFGVGWEFEEETYDELQSSIGTTVSVEAYIVGTMFNFNGSEQYIEIAVSRITAKQKG